MNKVTVEIVACSVEDCRAIERAGADRIELCSGILTGGVTPSMGLVRACREAVKLPIMVMVRPREGGFCYSADELDTMRRDLDVLAMAGIAGVVFGVLDEAGRIDGKRMMELRRRAGSMKVMCHRAFDVAPDPLEAIDALVDAGVDRLLSSGQRRDIVAGLPKLKEIMAHAAGRIEVQPCEGVRPENVTQVLQELSPTCIHLGPFVSRTDPTSALGSEVEYGSHLALDESCVKQVVTLAR